MFDHAVHFGNRGRPAVLTIPAALAAVLLAHAALPCAAHARQGPKGPEPRMLARVLKLLPSPPGVPIRFVDPDLVPDAEAVRRVDAFLVRERDGHLRQVIYLNRSSSVVERALTGRDLDLAVLASIIRHEMEHLRGGDEPQARAVERQFFQHLMFVGHVPMNDGLAYLGDLEQHHRLRELR